MKRRPLLAMIALSLIVVLTTLVPLFALADCTCQDWSCTIPSGCNRHLGNPFLVCKQLCSGCSQQGCCEYEKRVCTFTQADPEIPCNGPASSSAIAKPVEASKQCKEDDGDTPPCQTVVSGVCTLP
jgi:hypothetical protein